MNELIFEFEDEGHVYRLNGAEIPSCSAILQAAGIAPSFDWMPPDRLEFYRSRGTAVHKAVELLLNGTLDKRTMVDEIKPYIRAFEQFAIDHPFKELSVEERFYHEKWRYGVTPDLVVRGSDLRSAFGRYIGVIEIKATSAHHPATGIQLAGQALAVRQKYPDLSKRLAVRLKSDGRYEMKVYDNRADEAIFLAALNVYSWRVKNKLL